MASKFRIFFHRTIDSLHLKLDGDFDGNSANELLHALIMHGANSFKIVVYTDDIRTVYPSGRDVFQKNLADFNQQFRELVFVGGNKHRILKNWERLQ